jgi:hypothetical protein
MWWYSPYLAKVSKVFEEKHLSLDFEVDLRA